MRPDLLRPALWLRAAEWPLRRRVGICAAIAGAYLAAFLLGGPDLKMALRPVNLLLVTVAGLFFGVRGGWWLALAAVVENVLLYWHAGILARTPGTLSGNVLSIVIGPVVGAGVGWLRDLSLRLRREILRRREAERRKDELTALLVHDLKNPLTAISGHAQLLATPDLEVDADAQRESARYIHSAAERLGRMLMNLLDIGRAEDGLLTPRLERVELAPLLEELQAQVRRQLADKQQELVVLWPRAEREAADARLQADPELLRRILLNLLDNAIKYTPRRRTVWLEVDGTERELELSVRDQGPGIPEGYEERIFEKYVRLERDVRTAADASRGLGLHFCKLAADAHGGRIWVERNPEGGSVFRLRLPRARG